MGATLFGTDRVSEDQVRAVITPEATDTWCPVPHSTLNDLAISMLEQSGLKILNRQYQLSHGGDRFFATFDLESSNPNYAPAFGLRNAHDKKFPGGGASGSRVFVCKNLSFSAEEVFARKHTKNILRDLPKRMNEIISKVAGNFEETAHWFDFWQDRKISDADAKAFMWDVSKTGVVPYKFVKEVVYPEWAKPTYGDFDTNSVWTLYNAFTNGMKVRQDRNPHSACNETQVIEGMIRNRWVLPELVAA